MSILMNLAEPMEYSSCSAVYSEVYSNIIVSLPMRQLTDNMYGLRSGVGLGTRPLGTA